MKRRRILLINPNISTLVTELLATEARRIAGDAATIHAVTAAFGSASLECRAELVVAAHAVLEAIAAHANYDAAIVAAFGDPGLEAAEEIAAAPVFGLGRSGLRAAADGGRRFAIVTIGMQMREHIERMAAANGLSGRLVAIRFLEGSVLDVARDRSKFSDNLAAAANACARENGAESILFGGAPFAGVARELAGRIAVPVFDGLTSAILDAMQAPASVRAGEAMEGVRERKATSGLSTPLAGLIDNFLARRA